MSQNALTLNALAAGSNAVVVGVQNTGRISNRIMEMGIIPGAKIAMIKTAPFGGPVEVEIKGYRLAMRKSEAEIVTVIA